MLLPIVFLIQEANADAFTYSSLIVSDDTGSGFRLLQSGTPVVAANTTANLCPSAYGYAYQDGGRCCASEFDAYDDYLTISSRTCSEGDSTACASESCEKNTGAATSARASTVSCGNHKAKTCKKCTQGNGSDWCNGDCKWEEGTCVSKLCTDFGDQNSCPTDRCGWDAGNCLESARAVAQAAARAAAQAAAAAAAQRAAQARAQAAARARAAAAAAAARRRPPPPPPRRFCFIICFR